METRAECRSEGEERTRLALAAGGLVVWEIDVRTGAIVFEDRLGPLLRCKTAPRTLADILSHVDSHDRHCLARAFSSITQQGRLLCDVRTNGSPDVSRSLAFVGAYHASRGTAVGYAKDVTREKEAEEERIAIALGGAALGGWRWTISTGHAAFDARWAEMLGYSRNDIVPHIGFWKERVHPDDWLRVGAALDDYRAGRTPVYQCEHRIRHKDGHWVWVMTQGRIVQRTAAGEPEVLVGTHLDLTQRHKIEDALKASEARMRALMDAAPVGISFSLDRTSSRIEGNETMRRQFEASAYDNLSASAADPDAAGRKITYVSNGVELHDNELPLQRAVAEDREIGPIEFEVRMPSGRVWHCEASGAPIRDASGAVVAGVAVTVDITERKRAMEQERLLVSEVNHRAKNLLAVVQAIARQTRRTGDQSRYCERLSDRINALAASHELLARSRWRGVDLRSLLMSQLEHFADLIGTRIALEGDNVDVSPSAAQTLGMCIHELSTNAAKYGALSTDCGQISISWRSLPDNTFTLSWQETGGPPVQKDIRPGFGHRVLVEAAALGLEGEAKVEHADGQFSWRLKAPAGRVLQG